MVGSYQRGDTLDHFVVIEQLGEGGMGVVLSAYDPDLDRRVALKLLLAERDEDDDIQRLFREAKAMARLSHPNVVTVYEVGLVDEQVFIAMELVEGVPLDEWLAAEQPHAEQIIDAFIAAGKGLGAAHQAGMIHRDFKPANVIVGNDGRVRVLDFGLARTAPDWQERSEHAEPTEHERLDVLTRPGANGGTPEYMSPEQYLGQEIDERSDQFSFCVALYEGLFRRRPFIADELRDLSGEQVAHQVGEIGDEKGDRVAAPVRRILARGLQPSRRDRYSSMAELLGELEASRSTKRPSYRFAALAMALTVVGAVGVWQARAAGAEQPCEGAARHLVGVWDDVVRARLERALLFTDRPHAKITSRLVSTRLDDYATAWSGAHKSACEATHVHGEQSSELLDLRVHCLKRRLSEFDALVVALSNQPSAAVVDEAVKATFQLTPLAICADVDRLTAAIPPPAGRETRAAVAVLRNRLDGAAALSRIGHLEQAIEIAERVVAEARQVAYRPVLAESLTLLGELGNASGESDQTEATLREAARVAAECGDHRLVAANLTRLIYRIGNLEDRRKEALEIGPFAEIAVIHAQSDPVLEGRLLRSLGVVLESEGRPAAAIDHHRLAISLFVDALGDEHPEVATSFNNLGTVYAQQGKYELAMEQFRRAQAIREAVLSPGHPDVGNSLNNIGLVYEDLGDYDLALHHYRQAHDLWLAALGPDNRRVAVALNNIGGILFAQGELDGAYEHYLRVRTIREKLLGPEHRRVVTIRENIAIVLEARGDYDRAFDEFRETLAINEKSLGPSHPGVAFTLNRVGIALSRRGEYDEAIAAFRRSIAITEKSHGADYLLLTEPLVHLGDALAELGQFRAASAAFERGLAIAEGVAADHPNAAAALDAIGRLLTRRGRAGEALQYHQRALVMRERKLGARHPSLAVCLTGIGEAQLRLGRPALAISALERVLAGFAAQPGDPLAVAGVELALSRAIARSDRERASELGRRARDRYRNAGQAGRRELARAEAWLDSL